MAIRLLGRTPEGDRWRAYCDDDLPIEVREGQPPPVVELTWPDGSTTRAFLGLEMKPSDAGIDDPNLTWPPTRRLIYGLGQPPSALTVER